MTRKLLEVNVRGLIQDNTGEVFAYVDVYSTVNKGRERLTGYFDLAGNFVDGSYSLQWNCNTKGILPRYVKIIALLREAFGDINTASKQLRVVRKYFNLRSTP